MTYCVSLNIPNEQKTLQALKKVRLRTRQDKFLKEIFLARTTEQENFNFLLVLAKRTRYINAG
jgi:hypothetical protein